MQSLVWELSQWLPRHTSVHSTLRSPLMHARPAASLLHSMLSSSASRCTRSVWSMARKGGPRPMDVSRPDIMAWTCMHMDTSYNSRSVIICKGRCQGDIGECVSIIKQRLLQLCLCNGCQPCSSYILLIALISCTSKHNRCLQCQQVACLTFHAALAASAADFCCSC